MTDLTTVLRDLSEKASKATPGPWCIESHGEKGDGSNIIGVAFGPTDIEGKSPLSGWLEPYDAEGNEIDYYRDEEICELEHRTRNSAYNAAYLAACPPALIQALVEVVLQANAYRDGGWDSRELCKALDRLEAVAQHLDSAAANLPSPRE